MSRRPTILELKSHAVDRLDDILARFAPGGHHAGGTYTAKNPTRDDRKAGSFVVYTRGQMRGAFVEFAARDTEKGDVIDLVSYFLAGGMGFKDRAARSHALDWIAEFVGLAHMPDTARAAALQAAQRRRRDDASAAETAAKKRGRAFDMFNAAQRSLFGTLGEVYLREARGIDLILIPHLECSLRFAPAQEYWMGRTKDRHGNTVEKGPVFPAIFSAFRDREGVFQALHMTLLRPDGLGKAPVPKPKLIWPEYAGGVIRLTKGDSGMTPEEAADHGVTGPTGLSEGIEDGLTGALASPELRWWATGALSNLQNVPSLPCTDSYLVLRQNDWGSRAAVTAFAHGLARLEASGRPVAEIPAYAGKDVNDTLRGE